MGDSRKSLPLSMGTEKRAYTVILVIVILLFTAATAYTRFNPFEILANQNIFWDFITKDFLPPDILKARGLWDALLQTFEIALSSSFIAVCFAFLLAFLGSATTSPFPWLAKIIRSIGSFMRNIPALIWSFILVAAFGIGTTVGLLALVIETMGFLLRAFIETIDEVGSESLEALNALGANYFQKLAQCIIPASIPGYISWFLYCIEVNIRSSTIVGMVGGGGIGLVLMSYIKSFKYHIAGAIILIIAAVVILVDIITNWLRKKVLI